MAPWLNVSGVITSPLPPRHPALACSDLRFPELYQRLAWDMGAQMLLVPSAFTVATGGLGAVPCNVSNFVVEAEGRKLQRAWGLAACAQWR